MIPTRLVLTAYRTTQYKDFDAVSETTKRIMPCIQAMGCERLIPLPNVVEIAAAIVAAGNTPLYIKKDAEQFSIINTKTASYVLFKTHIGHERRGGVEKHGTISLRLPHDKAAKAELAYQLTAGLNPNLLVECDEQQECAKLGISPQVYDVVDYKDKRAIFVECFDNDLQAFDPGQPEKVPGEDPRPFPLTDVQIFTIFRTLSSHLEKLHKEGAVHRDVCLENVGLTYDAINKTIRKVFLTDYGTYARLEAEDYSRLKMYGHAEYAAPEYFRKSENIDERAADIYALCVLLSMLLASQSQNIEEWEPEWVFEIIEKKAELGPEGFLEALDSDQLLDVLELQESYNPSADPREPEDIRSFLKGLLVNGLDPNPERRPKAAELVALCNAWEKTHPKLFN
ncbi:MAG: protein kinase [Verrucomicrobia bacterium]|nr:protein kinase [Verrucomicrobiota bacterium]